MDIFQRILLFVKESFSPDVVAVLFTAIAASILYDLLSGPFRKLLIAWYSALNKKIAGQDRIISVQTPTGKSINIKVNSGISDEQARQIAMEILNREQSDRDESTTQNEK